MTIKIQQLNKHFGQFHALKDINLSFPENQLTALLGPSGCGKTTLLRIIAGLEFADNGHIWFGEKKVTQLSAAERDVGFVFQHYALFQNMTVFDNVIIAKHMRAKHNVFSSTFRISRKEEARMREETEALLREQGLWQHRDALATGLPYGLQRRLEIARALATEPKLLLLDEPAAGMNPQETLELADFIHEIRDKHHLTILLIEHHMDLVMNISDRIYVLDFGSLIAQGLPSEIQKNQHVIDAYLGVVEDE